MTSRASASSRSTSARMTRRIWSSTSAPIASRVCLSASSSSWKWRCIELASYRTMSPLTSERSCLRQLGRPSARRPVEPCHRSPRSARACGSSGAPRLAALSNHVTAHLGALVPAAARALLGSPPCRTMSPLTSERSCLRQLGRSSARTTLPEAPSDVVLGPLVHGLGEELRGGPELHQLAEQEESRRVGHAPRLLHVVRDDDDGQVALELEDQLLDARGGDRIERGARLVHQEHFRLHGQRAGDAEALLLAPRESRPRLGQAVLHL